MKNFSMLFFLLWLLGPIMLRPVNLDNNSSFFSNKIKKEIKILEKKIFDYRKNALLKNNVNEFILNLSRLLIKRGWFKKALLELNKIPKNHKSYWNSRVLVLRIYYKTYQFDKLEKEFMKIKLEGAHMFDLLKLKGEYMLKIMDYDRAKKIFDILYESEVNKKFALWGYAKIEKDNYNFKKAEYYVRKSLLISPNFNLSLELLADIYRIKQDWSNYEKYKKKAFQIEPLNEEILPKIAFDLVQREKKLDEGAKVASFALELNKYNLSAHHYFARGYSPVLYKNEAGNQHIKDLIESGNNALDKKEYGLGEKIFKNVLGQDPRNSRALIGLGIIRFYNIKYNQALNFFFQVLKKESYYGLAHYCITEVLTKKLENKNRIYPVFLRNFNKTNSPSIPEIDSLFINYKDLNKDLQKIIRMMVKPVGFLVKGLIRSGTSFYFMNMHQFLWESPYMLNSKGTREIGLRLVDDMKGQGGYHGNSNRLQQSRVKFGGFNVAGHELGHMIYTHLPDNLKIELSNLFVEAKKNNRTLDYYSASNINEYFAQGYEAFISSTKRPREPLFFCHTNQELLLKDPKLYKFINTISGRFSSREAELAGVIIKLEKIENLRLKENILLKYLKEFGDKPALLLIQGNIQRRRGELNDAIKIHKQIVSEFPDFVDGFIELSRDKLMSGENLISVLSFLKKNYSKFSDNPIYLSLISDLYFLNGDIKLSKKIIKKIISKNPYFDPYETRYSSPYMLKSIIHIIKGEQKKLIDTLKLALKRGVFWWELWGEMALGYLNMGDIKNGTGILKNAIALDKNNSSTRLAIAKLKIIKKKTIDAKKFLLENVKINPFCWRSRLMFLSLLEKPETSLALTIIQEGIDLLKKKKVLKNIILFISETMEIFPYLCYIKALETFSIDLGVKKKQMCFIQNYQRISGGLNEIYYFYYCISGFNMDANFWE